MDDLQDCTVECLRCAAACEAAARTAAAREDDGLLRTLVSCAGVARVLASLLESDADVSEAAAEFFADTCARAASLCSGARLAACGDACRSAAACARAFAAAARS